jgi:hypothetical protein
MSGDEPPTHGSVFRTLLVPWQEGPPEAVLASVTDDYVGHMLHLPDGERTREQYPAWIDRYRAANPGTRFVVEDQFESGDRVCTRLTATRVDAGQRVTANGINISRFEGDLVAEEWAIWSAWHPA